TTVAFTGRNGGRLAEVAHYSFVVPSYETPRIQECHITLGHVICELVENSL
ncbi:MAG: phosphoheptose isomerase, partial [Aquificae bacterium]|nr:phosphoheptose isomerase [Aquificota bacterium]